MLGIGREEPEYRCSVLGSFVPSKVLLTVKS